MGLMDKVAGLLGRVSDPAVSSGLLASSQAMLEGGSRGENFGLSMVKGARTFNDAREQYGQDQQAKQIQQMRLQQYQQQMLDDKIRRGAVENITDEDLKLLAQMDPSGALVAQVLAKRMAPNGTQIPDAIEIGERYNSDPAFRQFYDNAYKPQTFSGSTTVALPGGGFGIVQGGNRGGSNTIPLPGAPAQYDPSVQGAVAATQAAGTVTGRSSAEAGAALPGAVAKAEQALKDISELKMHPGLRYAVGPYSLAPTIPGTPQADAVARLEQVKGTTFLQAFESLKGGGAITEVEGKKAEQAIARLNRAQSMEAFQAALDDLAGVIRRGTDVARQRAGGGMPAAASVAGSAPGGALADDAMRELQRRGLR